MLGVLEMGGSHWAYLLGMAEWLQMGVEGPAHSLTSTNNLNPG